MQEALSKLASRSDLSTAKKRIDALEASVSAYGNEREEIIHNMEEKLTQNYEGELGKLKLRANVSFSQTGWGGRERLGFAVALLHPVYVFSSFL